MSNKLIFFIIFVCIGYFVCFIISSKITTTPKLVVETPEVLFPTCEDQDIPLMLTTSGNTLCKNATTLYIREQGKKYTVKKINTTDIYLPSSLNLIVFKSDNEIVIEKLLSDRNLQEVTTLKLDKGITPISILLHRDESKTMIFFTTQKEAHSPKDIKSVLFRIELGIDNSQPPKVSKFSFIEMLRAVNIDNQGTLISLRELYPFLIEKHRLLKWQSNPEFLPQDCRNRRSIYDSQNVTLNMSDCTTIEQQSLMQSSAGTVVFDAETSVLEWKPSNKNETQTLVTNISPEEWQLVAKYTTRNGKRVYNCFDFSESLQITLRTCLPEL